MIVMIICALLGSSLIPIDKIGMIKKISKNGTNGHCTKGMT